MNTRIKMAKASLRCVEKFDHSRLLSAFFALIRKVLSHFSLDSLSCKGLKEKPFLRLGGLGILGIFWLSLSVFPKPVLAAELSLQQVSKAKLAYQAYQNQDYELATQYFDEVGGFLGWFNAGDATYRNQDWESAVFYFRQAFQVAATDAERAKALYNLGNTYYKANLLEKAIEAYQGALHYREEYPKAQHNLAVAQVVRLQLTLQGKPKKKGAVGGKNKQQDGAFYGGQKPSDKQEPGKGGMGDLESVKGSKQEFVLPETDIPSDYGLQQGASNSITVGAEGTARGDVAQAILQAEQQQKVIADLETQLRQVQDKQKALLKRIFEREEGYMAEQKAPHQMPGIQPW